MDSLGAVKITVKLDDAEARRQLSELERVRKKSQQKSITERPFGDKEPIWTDSGKLPKDITDSFAFKHLRNEVFPEHVKARLRRFSQIHYQFGLSQQQAGGSGMGGLAQRTASFAARAIQNPQTLIAPISKAVEAVAPALALEQGIKYGAKAGSQGIEFAKSAIPQAADSSSLAGLQRQFDTLSAIVSNYENRIMSMFSAYSRTKDIGYAVAQIGRTLPEIQYYYHMSQEINVQERDLEAAFDRMKSKNTAAGWGAKLREQIGDSMRQIFGQSMGK